MPYTPQPLTTADLMILAMQVVLTHVLEEIGKTDERMLGAIKRGFDNAANDAERIALTGPDKRSDDAGSLLEIIEALRTMTFSKDSS